MTAESATSCHSTSRRALLAGTLGGVGAWAVGAVVRPGPALAEGETIVVGGEYLTATSRTYLANVANNDTVLEARSTGIGTGIKGNSNTGTGVWGESSGGSGTGVKGNSDAGMGVWGESSIGTAVYGVTTDGIGVHGSSYSNFGILGASTKSTGVYGTNVAADQPAVVGRSNGDSTGVQGVSGGPVPAAKAKTGVYGYANQDAASRGVWGFSGSGAGVYGQAGKNGYAVRANGRIKADKVSGVATIAAGTTSVTVSPGVNVTKGSFVLLTPKANLGRRNLWFTTKPAADTFTIRLSKTRPKATKIAWLLLG